MTTTLTIPRSLGGTILLTIAPPPPSTLPSLVVVACFRDGQAVATYRDGETNTTYRDGVVTMGGR